MAAIEPEFADGGPMPGEDVSASGGSFERESDLADTAPPDNFVDSDGDGLFVGIDGAFTSDFTAVEDLRHGGKPGQE